MAVGWGGRGGAGLQPGQLHLPDHDDPLDEGEISFLAGQIIALNMGQTHGNCSFWLFFSSGHFPEMPPTYGTVPIMLKK